MTILWLFIVFIFVIIFLLIVVKKLLLTPLGVYVSIWIVAFLFIPATENYLHYSISREFYISFLVNIVFLLFLIIIYINLRIKRIERVNKVIISNNLIVLTKLIVILSGLGILMFVHEIYIKYFNIWTSQPLVLRAMYFNGEMHLRTPMYYIMILLYSSALLSCAVIFFHEEEGKKIIYKLPIFFIILYSVFYFGRSDFVRIAIMYFFAYLNRKSVSKRFIIFSSAILVVIILAGSILIGKTLGFDNKIYGAIFKMGMYASGSIMDFDEYLRDAVFEEYKYGASTLYPVYQKLAKYLSLNQNIWKYIDEYRVAGNTYTMFRPFYEDFKWFGVLFFTFIFHVIIVDVSFRKKYLKNVCFFLFCILLYGIVLFSVQEFGFQRNQIVLPLAVSLIVVLVSRIDSKKVFVIK